ncbi:DNA-binding protein [Brevibacillus reuszeri]|uniref:DNA-binding protein n=1 Tax=Brevibacillus reuszeri TaxID=54915 RepID=A0A0K9YS31_9BACL|nr:helix-turn-helix transcriptional regulator [Brevibacillus reuszeri]KNB71000.1 DNA-binding protein [Brevibacillus reuszeri]MED1857418.1 helix-turn-helix transcriptional regulator [Brevibacillus reuszeri]GED66752.1 DNA-binding protein [Brevibacillus reuszeri]
MGKYTEELKRFIPIADAMAQTFGKNCEVVLHDLSSPQSSVIYTANNHVTGRAIGQSFNHLITQVLLSQKLQNDVVANYRTETEDGRTIKSTTALIRNAEGEAIGAFCINIDIQPLVSTREFIEDFIRMDEEPVDREEVEVVQNVWEIVEQMINQMISEKDVEKIEKNEKLQIVQFMDKKGVFLIKGALEKVAAELKISKVTMYSYLDELRRNHKQELEEGVTR